MFKKISFRKFFRRKYYIYTDKRQYPDKRRIFSISRIQILALSILAILMVFIFTAYLFVYTNIKEWILGYPMGNFRAMVVNNAILTDSLENELEKRDNFFRSMQVMIGGGEYGSDTSSARVPAANTINFDTILLRLSKEEKEFREMVEEEARFSLGLGMGKGNKEYIHFFPPVSGYITRSYNEREGHYGTDVVTRKDAQVMAVLDGVVIFADWTVHTGHVVAIQHSNNLVSVYKHNSVIFCKQGDYIRTGQAIANVGNSGQETTGPHLHFELWRAGSPLNPEDFIQFK